MKSFIIKHFLGFASGVFVSVLAGVLTFYITKGFEDPFPKALELLETASKYRSKLDIGQVEALEIFSELEKPLTGLILDEVYFKKGDFKNIKITDCTFMLSDISKAKLNGLFAKDSNFEFSNMSHTVFIKANIIGSDLDWAILEQSNFRQSCITNTSMNAIQANGVIFREAIINNVNFTGANLSNADFSGSTLENVSFVKANLAGVNFDNAAFCNVEVSSSNIDLLNQLSKKQIESICYNVKTDNQVNIVTKTKNLDGGENYKRLIAGTIGMVWTDEKTYKNLIDKCNSDIGNFDSIYSFVPIGRDYNKYIEIVCKMYPDLYHCR